jgi:hypothetical protein
MPQSIKYFLESMKVPSENVVALKIEPGAEYLFVADQRKITSADWADITARLGEIFNIKSAFLLVYGDPNESVAAFKIKD